MDLTAFFKIIILTPPAAPFVCVIETILILELAVAGLGRQYSSLARSIYLISNRREKRSEGDTVVEFRLDVRVANNIGYTGKEQDESIQYTWMSPGSTQQKLLILNLNAAEFAGKVVVYTNSKYS